LAQVNIPSINQQVVKNTLENLYRQGGLSRVAAQHDDVIRQTGRRYGVSEDLVKAAIYVESRGREHAQSPAGAYGPMQLMAGTATDLQVNRYNPKENIIGGTKYYGQLLHRYRGDTEKAIAAYNWGMGNVDRVTKQHGHAWRAALPQETRNYLAQYRAILSGGKPL
jgi:soluble lytic murein transglycosylase-like protein